MNRLEARFRRKFVPHGEDFRFQDANATVIFDRWDVERLVAEWRRYWLSPLFWGVMLVAAGWTAASFTFDLWTDTLILVSLLAGLTLVCGAVMLWVVQRGPSELANTLPSIGPGNGRPEWPAELWWFAFFTFQASQARVDGDWFDWIRYGFGLVALYYGYLLVRRVWRLRFKPAA